MAAVDDEAVTPTAPPTRPTEALAVELKPWLDPTKVEHQSVLVKGLIALRNHGGGRMMIGYRDDGSVRSDAPFDVRERYQSEAVQDLLSRHAAERFEIEVVIEQVDGVDTAVVIVPAGVRTPVRVKSAVKGQRDDGPHDFLRAGIVPMRTLEANGRASSSECGDADWEKLMQTCFDNREADVARFVRRHLAGMGGQVGELLAALRGLPVEEKPGTQAQDFLTLGGSLFADEVTRRANLEGYDTLVKWGGREASIAIIPEPLGFAANQVFLQRVLASLPRVTSYPPWADTSGSLSGQPQVIRERWQGFLFGRDRFNALTFDVFDPRGLFYEYRLMLLDVIAEANRSTPRAVLGERETLADVTEVLMTGLAFAQALAVADDTHEVRFAFRWTGLKDRLVDKWFTGSRTAFVSDEEASTISAVAIPADTPHNALGPAIAQVVAPLFRMFRGYETAPTQIEETLRQMIERRSPY